MPPHPIPHTDMSVRYSLQPQYLVRAAIQAGAAERLKDERHKEVISGGGIFFSLVVESLGFGTAIV